MNRFSGRTLAVAVGDGRSGVIETANNSDYTFIYDEKLADDSAVSIKMPVSHRNVLFQAMIGYSS
jgi:hypothetical protein